MARVMLLGLEVADPVLEGRWVLGGVEYFVRLSWNEREAAYIVDVYSQDLVPILVGSAARTGVDIFDNVTTATDRPPGRLYVEDATGADLELTLDGFRRGQRLVYDDDGVTA